MLKTEIGKDEPLFPGDEIEMHFSFLGPNWVYLHAAELALLKHQLAEKHPDWEMLRWDSTTDPEKLRIDFLITGKPPDVQIQRASAITPIIIAAAVLGTAGFLYLTFNAVYKITDSPAGKVALAGAGSLGIATLIIVVLVWLRYLRK